MSGLTNNNIMNKSKQYFIIGIIITLLGLILSEYIFPYNLPLNVIGGGMIGWNIKSVFNS